MFFRHTKCFLDIKIDTPSVFLTHQVFFRHKNWHPKCFLTHQVFFKVQFPLVSSLLELQSKSWVLELKLEPSALQELSQSCSSDSAFRKGLIRSVCSQFYDWPSCDAALPHHGNSVDAIIALLIPRMAACHLKNLSATNIPLSPCVIFDHTKPAYFMLKGWVPAVLSGANGIVIIPGY